MDMKPKTLFRRVLKFAREELERRALLQQQEPRSEHPPPETPSQLPPAPELVAAPEPPPSSDSEVQGLEVVRAHEGQSLQLRWAISEQEVRRAEALIQGNAVLCLRTVSFEKARDDVRREVQDRPGVERAGQCEIAEPPQRGVVSLGLRAGERFVSIAHHVL